MWLPPLLYQPTLNLIPMHLLERRLNHMLHMPRILVLHKTPLSLVQYLQHQARNIRFVPKVLDGREECFEIEHNGAGQREAPKSLPVHAQIAAREIESGGLLAAVCFVGVAGRHVEGRVDFEAPGAALDGLIGGLFGEVSVCCFSMPQGLILSVFSYVPVHRELHFLLIVRDGRVNFAQP